MNAQCVHIYVHIHVHVHVHTYMHNIMSTHTHTAQAVLTAAPPGKSGLGGICPGANLSI